MGFVSSLGGSLILGSGMRSGTKIALLAVIGGTAEALGGGKPARLCRNNALANARIIRRGGVANGAVTGAYVMMLNQLMHDWHPARSDAAATAQQKTTNTGIETAVLVYQDDQGDKCYWVCPHDPRNTTTVSYWVYPPAEETFGLKLVEQFHYSVKDGLTDDGKPGWIKGSFDDWEAARSNNIPVTHYTMGIGAWYFKPTLFFEQPKAMILPGFIQWNNKYPIKPKPWYTPFKKIKQ